MRSCCVGIVLVLMAGASLGAPPGTVVSSIGPLTSLAPSGIQLQGEIGRRFGASIENRLLRIEVDQLLACFERRDCTGSWDGEYVGKWLDAASLAYSVTRNQRLLERMDVVTRRLIATQDTDGYLGTYPRGRRFVFEDVYTSDVWVHRYVLIGLLSYYEATRDAAVWAALTRAADLLVETFGDRPEQRSILAVGYHQGLAATAVLEPMARLYAFSREPRYLEFCRAIVRAWDSPGGPRLLSHLLSRQPIQDLAGGKAYEILANVVGLVELYDITGDRELLTAAVNAWEEVSREQLYVTGGSSRFERFQAQGPRPYTAADDVQENCVTVTWLRLNHRLLQVTGEARFAESYMWTACNQLLASQARDASQWCYYCPLAGRKPYTPYLTCCSSNGPRGIAWFADNSVMTAPSGPAVLLYAPGSYGFVTPGGRNGTLRISGDFPFGDRVTIKVEIEAPEQFSLNLLTPSWARGATVEIPGRTPDASRMGQPFSLCGASGPTATYSQSTSGFEHAAYRSSNPILVWGRSHWGRWFSPMTRPLTRATRESSSRTCCSRGSALAPSGSRRLGIGGGLAPSTRCRYGAPGRPRRSFCFVRGPWPATEAPTYESCFRRVVPRQTRLRGRSSRTGRTRANRFSEMSPGPSTTT